MENIKIFEKHFRKGMINKDFKAFKRTHPTLLKCILGAMSEVLPQADVIGSTPLIEGRTKSNVKNNTQTRRLAPPPPPTPMKK